MLTFIIIIISVENSCTAFLCILFILFCGNHEKNSIYLKYKPTVTIQISLRLLFINCNVSLLNKNIHFDPKLLNGVYMQSFSM